MACGRVSAGPADYILEELTDPFMVPQFVLGRLRLIPLRPGAAASAAGGHYRLDVRNDELTARHVYSSELEWVRDPPKKGGAETDWSTDLAWTEGSSWADEVETVTAGAAPAVAVTVAGGAAPTRIFNDSFELALLQPGRRLRVENIRVVAGRARDGVQFSQCRRAAYTHLDLEQLPLSETHDAEGSALDLSGYVESSATANPHRHRLTLVVPATATVAEARLVVVGLARGLVARLARIRDGFAAAQKGPRPAAAVSAAAVSAVGWTEATLASGLREGRLLLAGETHTVGTLLMREAYPPAGGTALPAAGNALPAAGTHTPVAFCAYDINQQTGQLCLQLQHATEEPRVIVAALIALVHRRLLAIQRGLEAYVK